MKCKIILIILFVSLFLGSQAGPVVPGPHTALAQDSVEEIIQDSEQIAPADASTYFPIVIKNRPYSTIFGVEMDSLSTSAVNIVNQAGAHWVRRNALIWSSVEPNKGDRLWDANLDKELKNATAQGMRVILVIRGTPEWAQKKTGYACGPIVAEEFEAFASFMKDVVTRYSGAPYEVRYYELWNEPDVDPVHLSHWPDAPYGCWGDDNDYYYGGGHYGEMLKAVYPQVKAADLSAQILVGGLLLDCNPNISGACHSKRPTRFLEGILLTGAGNSFDGVSFHAYDYYLGALGKYENANWKSKWSTTGPVVRLKAQFLRGVLATYGFNNKYLINTEGAVLGPEVVCDAQCQETKAYYVAQIYAASIAEDLRANIWYSLYGWRSSGLLDADRNPLPAYQAYAFAQAKLGGAVFVQDIAVYPGVKMMEFNKAGKLVWLAWSTGGTQEISLPRAPSAIWDTFGEPQTITGSSLSIPLKPLYIEW